MVEGGSRGREVPVVAFAELEEDPHGVFRRYRRHFPYILRADGVRFVLRAADVRRLGGDARLLSPDRMDFAGEQLRVLWQHAMLFSNDTVHARRRAPFVKAFSFPAMARFRNEIAAAAHALIDGWIGAGRTELVESFANRLPLLAISRILGLPDADMVHVMKLVCSVARPLSGAAAPHDLLEIGRDVRRLLGGVGRFIEDRQRRPRDDVLGACLRSEPGAALSSIEMVVQVALIFIAATETTRTSMAALVVLLLEHRDQWDAVVGDLACRKPAVIEGLRLEPGVAHFARTAREPIEFDGEIVPAGSTFILSALSAMRDEALYEEPDRFDVFRKDLPKSIVAFGGGAHRCLGEALSLIVLEEGLGALASRLPGLRLTGPRPVVYGSASIRRITPVQVAWD